MKPAVQPHQSPLKPNTCPGAQVIVELRNMLEYYITLIISLILMGLYVYNYFIGIPPAMNEVTY